MATINKFLNWLLISSADNGQGSLAAKGLVLAAIPTAVVVLGLGHIQTDAASLTAIVDAFFNVVMVLTSLVAAVMTLIGLLRKFYLTAKGQNASVPQ